MYVCILCMYVCIYVCIYVCMYVYMYVCTCMDVCTHVHWTTAIVHRHLKSQSSYKSSHIIMMIIQKHTYYFLYKDILWSHIFISLLSSMFSSKLSLYDGCHRVYLCMYGNTLQHLLPMMVTPINITKDGNIIALYCSSHTNYKGL